jgi:ectoine hydroxylase-related dioxygenase (phytanoyl-CoA dioxygenase family)
MKFSITLFVTALCASEAFTFTTIPTRQTSCKNKDGALHMSDVSNLLYLEQEKLIVRRGELEEEFMSKTAKPLKPSKVKVRGTGSAGGFGKGGGAGGKSGKKAAFKAEGKTYSKILKRDGVVGIDNILSPKVADSLREYVYNLRQKSEEDVEAGIVQPIQRFADVLLKKDRCDLTIPLGDDIVSDALDEALRNSAAGQTIASILSEDAVLYELSCLMSDPGSQRQVIHPDTPFIEGKGPVLYTCFIALQDVRLDMGPTTWLPGTHTAEAHEAFMDSDSSTGESRKDDLIRNKPAVLGTLSKGSCAIFDSRCLHCGTANKSMDSRALFYFSFKNPQVGYPGNPSSIRSELGAANISMKALEEDLELRSNGKGQPLIDRLAATLR